jgi:catechol 2,3-dioxygenase-like lactoylglutathione lyase family enzyme
MPVSIQASAISHIALCVRDLERSLQFYRDGLGFQVTKDEVQDTSRGGLPHLYHGRHAPTRCPPTLWRCPVCALPGAD